MSIKKKYKYLSVIFLLVLISACSAQDDDASSPMRDMLYTNLTNLKEKGVIDGELKFDENLLSGKFTFNERYRYSAIGYLDSLSISIEKDNFECYFLFDSGKKPIEINMNVSISEAFLTGYGIIKSGENSAIMNMHSEKRSDDNFDLVMDVYIENLFLTGEFAFISSKFHAVLEIAKELSSMLGFSDLILEIKGDMSIRYLGLELECIASLNFNSDYKNISGTVISHEGTIWRYGKAFDLDYAAYQFEDLKVDVSGKYSKKAYYHKVGVGSVLQPFIITLKNVIFLRFD